VTTFHWSTWVLAAAKPICPAHQKPHFRRGCQEQRSHQTRLHGRSHWTFHGRSHCTQSQWLELLDPRTELEPISTSVDHPVARVLAWLVQATHWNAVNTVDLTRSTGTLKHTSKGANKAQGAGQKKPRSKGIAAGTRVSIPGLPFPGRPGFPDFFILEFPGMEMPHSRRKAGTSKGTFGH